jgi:hypothetical protein
LSTPKSPSRTVQGPTGQGSLSSIISPGSEVSPRLSRKSSRPVRVPRVNEFFRYDS